MAIPSLIRLAALALCLAPQIATAQTPAPQRPFDRVTGIVFTCGAATGFAWTGDACNQLSAEFRKRAAAAKLPFAEVPITADFRTRKRDTVDGFNQDKAVRVFWNFTESTGTKGQISAGLSSNIVYEPTKQDNPNIVPGQRIPMNFYAQSVLFDPGVSLSQADEYLNQITGTFFTLGEGKP